MQLAAALLLCCFHSGADVSELRFIDLAIPETALAVGRVDLPRF